MSGFLPLVFYSPADTLSVTLYELARKETEISFEINFASRGNGITHYQSHKSRKPSLILLEQKPNDADFQEEIKEMKSHPLTKDIPLIILIQPMEQASPEDFFDLPGAISFNKPQSLESMKLLIEVINILLLQEGQAN